MSTHIELINELVHAEIDLRERKETVANAAAKAESARKRLDETLAQHAAGNYGRLILLPKSGVRLLLLPALPRRNSRRPAKHYAP